jgi:glycosyltransferase involved in cell wall biosynthesis
MREEAIKVRHRKKLNRADITGQLPYPGIGTQPAQVDVQTDAKEVTQLGVQQDDTFSLKILALNWRCLRHPQAGGAEVNLFEQAGHWIEMGHNVTVVTSNPGRDHAPERRENFVGINIIRLGNRFTVYFFAMLYVLLFGWRYDYILDVSNGIPFFSRLFTRTPVTLVIHHVHGEQWASEFSAKVARFGQFLENKITPWVYRKCSVITVSPTTEQALLKLGYKQEQLAIVYNGVNVVFPMKRNESKKPTVAYVGRLKKYKRIDRLIEFVDELRHEFPDIHLEIAGIGDADAELEALIDDCQLVNFVTLHGYVDELTKAQILSRAHVFATPSMHEGWGISVIEANAYGCPAVAYNVPGLAASIPNNETGLLADDDDEFIEAIARILRDDPLRQRMSGFAKQWAGMFDWYASSLSTLSVMMEE